MKLSKIIENIYYDIFKPGTYVECMSDTWGCFSRGDIGKIHKVGILHGIVRICLIDKDGTALHPMYPITDFRSIERK